MSDWHKMRASGIGASEMAALVHADYFKTVYDIWIRKTDPNFIYSPTSEAQHWGHQLEDVIAYEYQSRTGHSLIDPGRSATVRHKAADWLYATIDREIIVTKRNRGCLECKFIGGYFNEKWLDGAPIEYVIQLQVQMEVCDYSWGVVVGLVGKELFAYKYKRDRQLGKLLFQWARDFWQCIERRERPAWYSPSYLLKSGSLVRRTRELPFKRVALYRPNDTRV